MNHQEMFSSKLLVITSCPHSAGCYNHKKLNLENYPEDKGRRRKKKRKTNDGISIIRGGGSLIFHHFPSFQQFFFLASKWPNSSRNAKKKISIFGDPPSYSASRQAFYVKILNIWLKNVWKKHLLQKLLKAWSSCQKELICIFHHYKSHKVKTSCFFNFLDFFFNWSELKTDPNLLSVLYVRPGCQGVCQSTLNGDGARTWRESPHKALS